jgi:branched-chain amino acid transport system permease protein
MFDRPRGKPPKDLSIVLLIMASLSLLLFFEVPSYTYRFLAITLMFASLALSWNILGGYAGYFSFGHMSFFGIGAYTVSILAKDYGVSPLLSVPAGGLLAGIVAVAAFYAFIRLEEAYFAIATLAFNFALLFLAQALDITGGPYGISLPLFSYSPAVIDKMFLGVFLVASIIMVVVNYKIENSRFGYALVAMREDKVTAESLGINTLNAKIIAGFLSGAATGLIGAIYPLYLLYINPETSFSIGWSTMLVVMVIFGGLGTWIGPLIGGLVFETITEVFTDYSPVPALSIVFIGGALVALILFLPQGINGVLRQRLRKVVG